VVPNMHEFFADGCVGVITPAESLLFTVALNSFSARIESIAIPSHDCVL